MENDRKKLIGFGIGAVLTAVAISFLFPHSAAAKGLDGVPAEYASKANPVADDDEVIAASKKIYKKRCKKCHGKKGNGKGSGAKDMDPMPPNWTDGSALGKMTDGQRFWIILNGSKDTEMKGWKAGIAKEGKEITEEQAWGLVHYINRFGK